MDRNVIFFAWNRSIPGREKLSGDHFQEFVAYLSDQLKNGTIQGFDPVFLDQHGGDLNGFILIRGKAAKLDALTASPEWLEHMTRGALHLEGSGAVRGVAGEMVTKRMELWSKHIPG